MSKRQSNWIAFVAQHKSGFATPAADGGVYIYFYAVHCATGRVKVEREHASSAAEVRAVLGY